MRCSLPAKEKNNFLVAVIGAGPAGLFASRYLARQGVQVVLFNRDIKPGGLAEYGIFPDKHKMRTGLMSQFKRILEIPSVRYQGNVKIGKSGDIELDQLRQAGFQALMVTTGAQQNNWLGLPGEDLDGVYQANDIVFHYNHLPERPEFEFKVGREVVVIGVGNVMLDIVHYLKKSHIPCTVTAYARRGPTEVKFDQQTLEPVASCLDLQAIQAAVDGARPDVESVGNNVNEFYVLLEKARMKAKDCDSDLQFQMRFLCSPRRLVGDEHGRVREIVFELNHLVQKDDQIESRGSGVLETVAADTVIFSVGSNPEPRFPVDGISYEVYNPDLCARCEDIFVSGWARSAGEGIVGLARKDAERGAKAVLAYLDSLDLFVETRVDAALERLPALDKTIVDLADLEKIWNAEQKIAAERGLPAFKFPSQKALLRVIKES